MPTQILLTRLTTYRKYREWLKEARETEFKTGRPVRVINERFNGYGLVTTDENCPLDWLPVKLENNNVWWYPLEDCSLAKRDNCPPWLQRMLKKDSTVRVYPLRHKEAS